MNGEPGAEAVLSLEDISFHYGGQQVLDGINLRLERGTFLGLIGPNGSGKTTLLKVALGLLKPQRGVVRWFGQLLTRPGQFGSRVAYVPQLSQAYVRPFPVTVRELVAAGRVPRRGLLRPLDREDREAVEAALAAVGMADRRDDRLSDLSGGQQQRAFIARALAADAEVLLLDEPTSGIDAAAQERFYDLLGRLQRDTGRTLLLVSHDLAAITRRVTHLACINRRLLCSGTVAEVAHDPEGLARAFGDLRLIAHSHGEVLP
ncbi:MAG TPA: metal ABC transporter ATP-binding protein [Bacillota bacterium]